MQKMLPLWFVKAVGEGISPTLISSCGRFPRSELYRSNAGA
jgi:hypothetical protein